MKLKTLCVAMLLAAGSIGIACANPVNVVKNGDFNHTQSPNANPSGPWQFGHNSGSGYLGPGNTSNCTYGGQFVSNWSGNGGSGIWYPSASAASGTDACTQYQVNGDTQRLPPAVGMSTVPGTSGTFIGLDGQPGTNGGGINFGVSQSFTNLTPGAKYTVSFYWGATQEMSRMGVTSEMLQVALGNEALFTPVNVCSAPFSSYYNCTGAPGGFTGQSFLTTPSLNLPTHGWTGWMQQSFTFTANSANSVLSFLSIGTPENLPPFAVLTDVSMTTNVPEPPALALFGGGLLGLGLMTVFARRRALRKQGAAGDLA